MAVTASTPALALETDAPPPSATGVFQRHQLQAPAPWWANPWVLVAFLLLGGGGGSVIGGLTAKGDDTGAQALAKVETLEGKMGAIEARQQTLETEASAAEAARVQHMQYLRWMAEVLRKQSDAIKAIGSAQGVAVDLNVGPLLPE